MKLAVRVELVDLDTGDSVYIGAQPFEPSTHIAIDVRKAGEEALGYMLLAIARDLTSKT